MDRAGAWLTASRIRAGDRLFPSDSNLHGAADWDHLDIARAQLHPLIDPGNENRSLESKLLEPLSPLTAHPHDHAAWAAPDSVAGGLEAGGDQLADALGHRWRRRGSELWHQGRSCV